MLCEAVGADTEIIEACMTRILAHCRNATQQRFEGLARHYQAAAKLRLAVGEEKVPRDVK